MPVRDGGLIAFVETDSSKSLFLLALKTQKTPEILKDLILLRDHWAAAALLQPQEELKRGGGDNTQQGCIVVVW